MATTTITTGEVKIPGPAVELKAFVARPDASTPAPAVIVVQEWWGLNDNIRDITQRFAREGYFAVAPDLYSRQGHKVTSDPNVAAQLMQGLNKDDGIADLLAVISWLKAQKEVRADRIGVVGFCMGGSYALLLPCRSSDIKAAAPFYGEVPPDAELRKIKAAVFYAYGENDGWIQRKDVDRLAATLKQLAVPGEVKIYQGAAHGFFNDTRKDVYDANAASDAWERTLRLFREHLMN